MVCAVCRREHEQSNGAETFEETPEEESEILAAESLAARLYGGVVNMSYIASQQSSAMHGVRRG